MGDYGCKRFLRDGFKTPIEEESRLYYNFDELGNFDKIESEWPMFLAFLAIKEKIFDNEIKSTQYIQFLKNLLVKDQNKNEILPFIYVVDKEQIDVEKQAIRKTKRVPYTYCATLWTQCIYLIANLLDEHLINCSDIYPPKFRKNSKKKKNSNIQIIVVAQSKNVQSAMKNYGFSAETFNEIDSFKILPISSLKHIFLNYGVSKELGLHGRMNHDTGILCTSSFYNINGKFYYFTAQVI